MAEKPSRYIDLVSSSMEETKHDKGPWSELGGDTRMTVLVLKGEAGEAVPVNPGEWERQLGERVKANQVDDVIVYDFGGKPIKRLRDKGFGGRMVAIQVAQQPTTRELRSGLYPLYQEEEEKVERGISRGSMDRNNTINFGARRDWGKQEYRAVSRRLRK